MQVCHRCDTPRCVNPTHLFLGTQLQNLGDMRAKGRQVHGSRIWSSRVTETDVRLIREEYTNGKTIRSLAAKYKVGAATISGIVRRITWQHVD